MSCWAVMCISFLIIGLKIQIHFVNCLGNFPLNTSDIINSFDNIDKSSSFNNKFVIIPTILENEVNRRNAVKWYTGETLKAITKKFSTVLLTVEQWNTLISEVSDDAKGIPDMIVEFSSLFQQQWDEVGTRLVNNSLAKQYVKWIAIPVLWTNFTETDNSFKYVKKLSELITEQNKSCKVGCFINSTEFLYPSQSQLEVSGRRCIENGGKFIITSIHIDLKTLGVGSYSKQVILNIQKQLHQRQEIRSAINETNPDVVHYIRVVMTGISQQDFKTSAFCNEKALNINKYFELILNWAQQNEFFVILKSAFDSGLQPSVTSWMSMLRPNSFSGTLSVEPKPLPIVHPIFVMRNYPSSINGWTTEPCIPWPKEDEIPTFYSPNFVQNNQTGGILRMNIRDGHELTKEEFQNMIQFMLHKFSFADFIVRDPSNISFALDTLAPQYIQKIAKYFPNQNFKLYVNYQTDSVLTPEMASVLYPKVRDFRQNSLVTIKGFHMKYELVKDGNNPIFELLTTASTIIPIGIEIQGNSIDVLQQVFNKSSDISKTLELSKYVVCVETIDVEKESLNINIMSKMFDTHLYVKKILKKVKPELDQFFKIEADVDLKIKGGKKSMQQYKRLISMIQMFGAIYDIQYFIVEAFDVQKSARKRNGWWMIQNYTDMTNFDVYVEKDMAMQGLPTWKPEKRILKPEATNQDGNTIGIMLAGFSGGTIILLVVATGSFLCFIRYRRISKLILSAKEVHEFRNGCKPQDGNVEHYKFNTDFQLALNDLSIDIANRLGTGQFGTVYRGTVKRLLAAIKIPNLDFGKATFKNVLGEVKVLCHLGSHQHIVSFLGAYVNEIQNGKLYIATELCQNGSLEKYLRKQKAATQLLQAYQQVNADNGSDKMKPLRQQICQFSLEIARGMEYISDKNVVHGDLAARNIMLDSNLVCKIGDFGLSRKLYQYEKYTKKSQEPLPWKWMAIESLTQMEFTSKSDVWSYAVLVWEICTLGEIPYAGLHWSPKFSNELRNGLRLPLPQLASAEIYEKLTSCWNLNTEQRPTFKELVEFFLGLRSTEYLEVVPL